MATQNIHAPKNDLGVPPPLQIQDEEALICH